MAHPDMHTCDDLDDIAAHIQGGEPVRRRLREVDRDTLQMALWMVDAEP